MFLDGPALRQLTGFAHRAKQIEQLRAMGVPFWINARGQPVVACSAVEGGRPVAREPKATTTWNPTVLARR